MTKDSLTPTWTPVCPAEDIPEGEAFRVELDPPISVFRSDGEFFAVDDTCTHEDFSLAEGWVEDCTVECALHLAKFDLRTGKAMRLPAKTSLRCHEVRVDDDGIVHLRLPPGFEPPSGD